MKERLISMSLESDNVSSGLMSGGEPQEAHKKECA